MLATKAECLDKLRSGPLGSLQAPFFEWFVDLVQDYFYYRDFERFYNDKTMSRSRDLYEAIARRFTAKGLLTDTPDVFFLGRQEMLTADRGELTARQIAVRVRSRRRVYEKYSHQEPPKYIRGWQTFDDDQVDADGSLRGIAASSGVVTGRARVCRELSEIARVQRGDILVTVATDPGWTTVFSIIGGVVVETGGVVAHAVMISREYGLPCVANLGRACDLIPDGALITVDGTSGRVMIHDPEPEP
jgi:pyruvate,water dikinase